MEVERVEGGEEEEEEEEEEVYALFVRLIQNCDAESSVYFSNMLLHLSGVMSV